MPCRSSLGLLRYRFSSSIIHTKNVYNVIFNFKMSNLLCALEAINRLILSYPVSQRDWLKHNHYDHLAFQSLIGSPEYTFSSYSCYISLCVCKWLDYGLFISSSLHI